MVLDSDYSTGLHYPTFEQLGPDSCPLRVRFKIYLESFINVEFNAGGAAWQCGSYL